LYTLGGLILLTGVLFLIAQVWEEIGSFGRVALTLGLGFVSVVAAVLAEMGKKHGGDLLPSILFGIGGVQVTPGVFIFLDELGSDVDSLWVPTAVFAMLAAMYALLRYTFTSVVLTFFTIAHATAFLYACTAASTEGLTDTNTIFELLTILIGGAYLMLARAVIHTQDSMLVRPLVGFGTLGVLGALFALMTEYAALEIVYPFAVLGMYYLGIMWERRTMLILGSLFFIGYISYITAQYFADSIGWPLALIFLGAGSDAAAGASTACSVVFTDVSPATTGPSPCA
jgi:hypothetical protein